MIIIKTPEEIKKMQSAGRITALALLEARRHVAPGISTAELDWIVRTTMEKLGARPSFLNLYGFPASACISVNQEVIHGIPDKKRILRQGDIVSIDAGAFYDGFHGDSAVTIPVGEISPEAQRLIRVTEECFYEALKQARAGQRIGDLGAAVEAHAVKHGYLPVKEFIGHGVGRDLHEDPEVPNYGVSGHGARLEVGMTIAIEPMINEGTEEVTIAPNEWTVLTKDGKLSAHYEHTIAITEDGPLILTAAEDTL